MAVFYTNGENKLISLQIRILLNVGPSGGKFNEFSGLICYLIS